MAETLRELLIGVGFDVDMSTLPKIDRQFDTVTKKSAVFDTSLLGIAKSLGAVAVAGKAVQVVGQELGASADAAVSFGRDMAAIQTILPGQKVRVTELRGEIQQLAMDTGKSSQEIAAAFNDVLQTFDDTADTAKLAELAVKGATASGTDARTSFNLLSGVMLAYGEHTAKAAQATMDMAFATRQAGKIEIAEMAQGMGTVTGMAKQLGVTQKELFSIIGTASGVTGPAAEVFTQLSGIMNALLTPTKDLSKVYKQLGIANIDATIASEGLVPVLEKIRGATDGSASAMTKLIPETRALRLALPLTTTLLNRYNDFLKINANAAGKAAEANEEFRGGFNETGTKLEQLDAKLKTVQENFGQRLGPMQVAWKEAWIGMEQTAIESIDAVTDALNTVTTKREDPAWMRGLKQFAGSVAVGADVMGGLLKTTGTLDMSYWNDALDRAKSNRSLIFGAEGFTGQDVAAGRANTHRGAGGVHQTPVDKAAAKLNLSITNNVTLPQGVSADQFIDAVNRRLQHTTADAVNNALARDVQPSFSGENP